MKRRFGLRGKATLFTVAMAVLLGLVLGGYGYYQLRKHQMHELERWGVSTAGALARNAAYGVFTEDRATMQEMASGALSDADVLAVGLRDADGRALIEAGDASLLAGTPPPLQAAAARARQAPAMNEGEAAAELVEDRPRIGKAPRHYRVIVPVTLDVGERASVGDDDLDFLDFQTDTRPSDTTTDEAKLVGQAVVVVSQQRVRGILARALGTSALTTLLVMSLATVMAFVYMRRIVRPLEDMTEVAERMGEGDFSRSFDTSATSDEVALLVGAFGAMKESVRRHTEQLYEAQMQELALANEEVMNANAELLKISRRKSAFLADMSHELRTPLNAVIGFADIMNEGLVGELNEEQTECVSDILSSAKHLLTLINDILDIAKIEAGKAELYMEPVKVPELVEEVVTTVKALAHQKRLELVIDVPDDLGEIVADGRRLKQVLLNLLGNAVKYTKDGSVRLVARRVEQHTGAFAGSGTPLLRVDVFDTGVGIAADDRDRIFSEFDRVDNKYSREQEGSGLGLALCKKLVELHGGQIDFTSEDGDGSHFFFFVPWRIASFVGEEVAAVMNAPEGVKPLVLVIEDDRAAASAMTIALRSAGYRADVAASAAEGLEKIRSLRPHAVTLDLKLPDQDGWAVLEEIRNAKETAHLPVIVLSGEDSRAKGVALGASGYLVKPVERKQFLTLIQSLVRPMKPGRVLAVDDDSGMLRWYEQVLGEAGWDVATAAGGQDCLDFLEREAPDMVILDLMMRGMSGYEVLEAIRGRHELDGMPVVVVTAKDLNADERARLDGDVERILQKGSFGSRELVHELVGLGSSGAGVKA